MSFVDAVWAFGIGIAALYLGYAFQQYSFERLFIYVAFVVIWSFRLSWHIGRRVLNHYPVDDKRYANLRSSWQKGFIWKAFLFFQFQALTQLILCLPILALLLDNSSFPRPMEIYGSALVALGQIGEWIADRQLKRFKVEPANSGRVCDIGLWHFSRHPNYFFEWLIWCGLAVAAFQSPGGWIAILAPVMMFLLLLFVTGVKPSEEQSIQSKGDRYRLYQRTTNAFFPWFPRNNDN